jgi:hypothetical protein
MANLAPPTVYHTQAAAPRRVGWPPAYRPVIVVPRKPAVQLKAQLKFYPNMNASAAVPVDRDEIFHLNSFYDQYRLAREKSHGQLVANSKYIFVRMTTGEMLLHHTYRHPTLAGGKPVLYAGEVHFENGKLDWWSNGSGNYRPDPEHAEQAALPMDRFYTYQDVMKGIHKSRMPFRAAESHGKIAT